MTTRDGTSPLVTRQTLAGVGALLAVGACVGVVLMLASIAASLDWWDMIPLALFVVGASIAVLSVATLAEIVQ